jgi:hypothetical protein
VALILKQGNIMELATYVPVRGMDKLHNQFDSMFVVANNLEQGK